MKDRVTGPGPAGLSVRRLTVAYGRLRAVSGVDLEVAPGEVVALLGPSGCGKSSLLRAVAGLEDVADGQVLWDGRDVVGVPVHRRGFGLMFQDGQLFEHRDVAGNVAYGLAGLPRARRAERVEEMLALVGLSGLGGRQVSTLSGGQAQRVALARSLAPSPRLLLLDEPLSALDRALRDQLAGDLRAILRQQGTTALYVTHDQDEAMTVADRVGVMSRGGLLRVDTPERLWADPGSREVAQFLGYGPFLDVGAQAGASGLLARVRRARAAGLAAVADEGAGLGRRGGPGEGAEGAGLGRPGGVGGPQEGSGTEEQGRSQDIPPGGPGGCLALAPGALRVEERVLPPEPEGGQTEGLVQGREPGPEVRAGQVRLAGTVRAARLRRGQWEAEVVLDLPRALSEPRSPEARGGWWLPEGPGAGAQDGPAASGHSDSSAASLPAHPGAPTSGGSGAPRASGPSASVASPGSSGPAGALALAGRAHRPGERVVLLLDLARTALVRGGASYSAGSPAGSPAGSVV